MQHVVYVCQGTGNPHPHFQRLEVLPLLTCLRLQTTRACIQLWQWLVGASGDLQDKLARILFHAELLELDSVVLTILATAHDEAIMLAVIELDASPVIALIRCIPAHSTAEGVQVEEQQHRQRQEQKACRSLWLRGGKAYRRQDNPSFISIHLKSTLSPLKLCFSSTNADMLSDSRTRALPDGNAAAMIQGLYQSMHGHQAWPQHGMAQPLPKTALPLGVEAPCPILCEAV